MTNSAIKPLLNQDRLDKTTYINMPADQTVGLKQSMSDYNASVAAWTTELISQANNFQKMEESRNKDLYKLLPRQGGALALWLIKKKQAKQLNDDYIATFQQTETRRKENAFATGLAKSIEQTDVQNQKNTNTGRVLAEEEAKRNGITVDPGDIDYALRSAVYKGDERSALTQLANEIPQLVIQAAANYQFKGLDGQWKTLDQVQLNSEEWEHGLRSINELVWMKALELSDDKILLRNIILESLKKNDSDSRTKRLRVAEQTFDTKRKNEQKFKLAENITKNTQQGFADALEITAGKYPVSVGKSGEMEYDYKAANTEMTTRVVELINDGLIGETETDEILMSKPRYGTHPAQNKKESLTFADLNPLLAKQITAAQRQRTKEDLAAKQDTEDNAIKGTYWAWREENKGKPITVQMLQEYRRKHRDNHGQAPLPSEFTKLETVQEQDSSAALGDLQHYVASGGRDYKTAQGLHAGVTHPEDMEKAKTLLEFVENQGMDTGVRDDFVANSTNQYTEERIGKLDRGSIRWTNTYNNLIDEYNSAYADARDAGQSTNTAHGKGRDAVKRAIAEDKAAEDKTLALNPYDPWDETAATNLKKTTAAIRKDRSILFKSQPMPGEEAALKQAEFFYEHGGEPVAYYQQIAEYLPGMNWKQLMDKRWELSGGKAKKTDLEETVNNLPPEDQKLINQNNPSATLRLLLKNTEFADTFNVDSQQNPDYNYIRAEGGAGPIETEIPLTQMTVGQVLELAKTRHHDIGAFGLDGLQLVEALEGIREDWELDTVFDEEFQNKLIKGALRSKANKQNAISGVDTAWMSLTNINENLANNFVDTTGIKDPYRQPDTMPEAVAMAAVDLYLPDMA